MCRNVELNGSHGQALLELAVAIIGVVVFVQVTAGLFFWFTQSLIERNREFQKSRKQAACLDPDPNKCKPGKADFYVWHQRNPIQLP